MLRNSTMIILIPTAIIIYKVPVIWTRTRKIFLASKNSSVGLGTWFLIQKMGMDELVPYTEAGHFVRPLVSPLTRLARRTHVLWWHQSRSVALFMLYCCCCVLINNKRDWEFFLSVLLMTIFSITTIMFLVKDYKFSYYQQPIRCIPDNYTTIPLLIIVIIWLARAVRYI